MENSDNKNIKRHTFKIDRAVRELSDNQKSFCLWFTGLSGSGKSTIANLLEEALFKLNKKTYVLDGDNLRHGLNADLGFSDESRVENIRRVSEVAKLMVDAGIIVIVTLISPFKNDRGKARSIFKPGEFIEIFIDAPLDVCETRDPKGLYKKARSGEIKFFTGIDSRYEVPEAPEIHLKTTADIEDVMKNLLDALHKQHLIS